MAPFILSALHGVQTQTLSVQYLILYDWSRIDHKRHHRDSPELFQPVSFTQLVCIQHKIDQVERSVQSWVATVTSLLTCHGRPSRGRPKAVCGTLQVDFWKLFVSGRAGTMAGGLESSPTHHEQSDICWTYAWLLAVWPRKVTEKLGLPWSEPHGSCAHPRRCPYPIPKNDGLSMCTDIPCIV